LVAAATLSLALVGCSGSNEQVPDNHRIGSAFRHNAGNISKNAGVNNLVALTGRVVIAHALHIPVVV
ncbi:hypothetical protein GUG79_10415, partial [Xanthomonas citri pv. citri]|nr:hypothetical protein [Xanthomonas citri pv. citri]